MNRFLAVFLLILLIAMELLWISTGRQDASDFSLHTMVAHHLAFVALVFGVIGYCGFAALHAMQHLNSPKDRSIWLILIVGANILGACWYLLTTYQTFRRNEKGWLMNFRKTGT